MDELITVVAPPSVFEHTVTGPRLQGTMREHDAKWTDLTPVVVVDEMTVELLRAFDNDRGIRL